jgi:hypothetical protein
VCGIGIVLAAGRLAELALMPAGAVAAVVEGIADVADTGTWSTAMTEARLVSKVSF